MRKPIIIYRERYLPLSETFIYEQITNLKKYIPYVLCREKTDDACHFPYPRVYQLQRIRNKAGQILSKGIRLIYARFGMGGVQMLPLKRITRLPLLTSFHGSDVSRQLQKKPYYRNMLPRLFEYGDQFTVVCEYMKDKLIELGCPEKKIRVLKSGIDLNKFPYEPKYWLEHEANIRILSVGRLTEKKGMSDLIEAFSRVVAHYPEAMLTIIGDGEEREKLEQLIDRLGLRKQVELMGLQEHEQVRAELRRCDLFVLASCKASDGNEEGIPNVIMEAMAAGRVVVATEHAGIPELVQHMETGYLSPEKAPERLAERILYALHHQEDWRGILDRARRKVEQEHDIEKQIDKLENLFDQLTARQRVACRKKAAFARKRAVEK